MLSERHLQSLRELSQSDSAYGDLKQLVENIVNEHTQQLEAERNLAHDYINQVATALISLDKYGIVTLVNRRLCEITGYSVEELMGQDWFKLCIPKDEIIPLRETFSRVIEGDNTSSAYNENYVITKSGELRFIAWHITYHKDDETGEILGSFSSGEDITDLKQSEQLLYETQEQLSAILDGIVDGVAVIGADERLLFANKAVVSMLGFDSFDDMATTMRDGLTIKNVPQDQDGDVLTFEDQALYRALNGDIPDPQIVVFSNPDTDKKIWTNTKAKPIFDENGNVRFVVIILSDITRMRQMENVKYELVQEQAQIDTLREFIAKTTHDLAQPLSVINTALYMLNKSITNDLVQKRTASIKTQSLRMQAILRGIQQMSILDGMKNITITLIDPKSLIRQIADYGKSLADEKQLEFIYEYQSSGKMLMGNSLYLDRAIMHVLQNALEYTDAGGQIHLGYYEQGTEAVIKIEDTGIGIPEGHLKHIFERFYRTDKSRTSHSGSGSGLGLAIASRVMDLHGGRIEVESKPDVGSIFRLILPIHLGNQ